MNVMPDLAPEMSLPVTGMRPSSGIALSDIAGALRRRYRLILACVVLCLAAAVAYLAIAPRRYTATALIVTDTREAPAGPGQVRTDAQIDPAVIDSQIELLKSDHMALAAVDRLDLVHDPEFVGSGPGPVGRILQRVLGPDTGPVLPDAARQSAVAAVRRDVKIVRSGHSYLAEIAATTLDPMKSARIANGVAQAYIDDQLEARGGASDRALAWLKQRADAMRAEATAALARSEAAANGPSASDGTGTDAAKLAAAANDARANADALLNRYNRLRQFTDMQALPVTEARIVTEAQPPLSKSAPKSSVILILALAGGLAAGVGAALFLETMDHRIRRPGQLMRRLGLPFAGILPATRQRMAAPADRTSTVSRLEVALLGEPGRLPLLFDSARPACAGAETLRSLKIALDQGLAARHGLVVGIVSPLPGEGKTTLAANLAKLMAETGARVLVIDGDFRQRTVVKALAPDRSPGLPSLVDAEPGGARPMLHTEAGFDVLGCTDDAVPLHPFQVLGSPGMRRLVDHARSDYDYVILDLPALLTSVDGQSAAALADGFILVTRFGRTRTDEVEAALATSDRIAGRIVASVINRAPPSAAGRRGVAGRRFVEVTA